jgi:ribosomal protein L11 methylase PrmA
MRVLDDSATEAFRELERNPVWHRLIDEARVVRTTRADVDRILVGQTTAHGRKVTDVLVHERVPYISYPYEWPVELLHRAALHHLDLHLDLLEAGFTLIDGSAYNVQFIGSRPVFIDIPSIRPYREGEYWHGYHQFSMQLLAPLLCDAVIGVSPHAWLRGSYDGIPLDAIWRCLPLRARCSWKIMLHIGLHQKLNQSKPPIVSPTSKQLPRATLKWMLHNLRSLIEGLKPTRSHTSVWNSYTTGTSYSHGDASEKRTFIGEWMKAHRPKLLADIGCNDGEYSAHALHTGAEYVVGFDSDPGAMRKAVQRADTGGFQLLPLVVDFANPSPTQGWAQNERAGFLERAEFDGMIALALLHHLVIARNIPLPHVLKTLVGIAPKGIIEFVPKHDPQVRRLLSHRNDMFPDFSESSFRDTIGTLAHIDQEHVLRDGGRILVAYRRK